MKTHLCRKTQKNRHTEHWILILVFMLFAFVCSASAQTTTVKGVVTDAETNEPLIGVSINVVGEKTGTITDLDGKYEIKVNNSSKALLQFSYMGFAAQSVKVGGQSQINVKMNPDSQLLDEVVAIGYGSARRGDLSGAISSVSSKDIQDMPVASAAEAMVGRMAGVQISSMDGSPDAEMVIRVRGGGSITQDNSPLLIVDGFPVSNINDIAPTDIENIVVLKDASSTAIYGARGANGVVLITTKSAKAGKTTINFNTFIQRKFFPSERKFDVLSPYEYVLAQYEYAQLKGTSQQDKFQKFYGDYEDIDIYKNIGGIDWQDKMFGGAKQYSKYYNVSVTGGSEKTKMNFSVTRNEDDGLLKTSGFERTNMMFKLSHNLYNNVRLELNSRYSHTVTKGAGTSGGSDLRTRDIVAARPTNGLADFIDFTVSSTGQDVTGGDEDEYERFLAGLVSPVEKAKQDYRNKTDRRFDMNMALNWDIMKNLTFRSEYGVGFRYGLQKRYWGPLTGKSRNEGGNLPVAQRTSGEDNNYRLANTLSYNYKNKKKKYNLGLMVGQEILSSSSSSQDMVGKNFPVDIAPERLFANFAKGTILSQSTTVSPDDRIASFFGRVNYSLRNRYIMNFTLRADGSTKFAPGKQWGIFPAASLAWMVSEEKFMSRLDFLPYLKLRASYGQAGNNRMGNDLWRYLYEIKNDKTIGYGETIHPYYKSGTIMPNPNLKWETTITQNVGIDFGFLRNRINGTIDVYNNKTKDLLIQADIPVTTTGYQTQMQNIGKTSNKGIELSLNGTIVSTKDFNLSANFNIGFNKFKIEKLDGNAERIVYSNWISQSDLKEADDYRLYVGSEMGLMYGYVSDGFYTVDDFKEYNPATGKYILNDDQPDVSNIINGIGLRPGIMKLKKLVDDGTNVITSEDRKIIGRATPKHSGGFGFNATYKGFDCSMFFNWKYGFDVYNTSKMMFNTMYRNDNANMLNSVNYANRFKYINEAGALVTDLDELRVLNKDANIASPFSTASSVLVFTSDAVEDGSYLRLSNVTLGYSLPKALISKYRIQQLRVYTTVSNVWIWTKYSGYDPDVSTNRSNSSYSGLSPNVDYSAYPKSRSFTLGLNVTF